MELDTKDALLRFMEDEGLSPFTLLKISPKPTAKGKKLPESVVMEWGLCDLEHQGDRERFIAWRVTAEALEIFRSEGELDRFEECNASFGEADGIDLRLEAGGTLFLRCRRLIVSDEPVERLRKGRPRPHHGSIHIEIGTDAAIWGDVRTWLGIPPSLACLRHLKNTEIEDDVATKDAKLVKIVDDAGNDLVWLNGEGRRINISRGKWAADDLWNGIWSRVTTVPGVTRISSRDLVCPPGTWPGSPPRKPTPQVWPYVYGVTCDFAGLTLDGLRSLLGLSAQRTFVFDGVGAPERDPALTLGAAVRNGRSASGDFHDERDKPIVHVHADLHESTLSFRRIAACDDATWRAVWRGSAKLPGMRARNSRTTRSPPDPWPEEPPSR